MSGFIKLNRKFFEHSFWNEARTHSLAEAWLDLIRSARFEVAAEKVVIKMNVITINRGELRASQRYLAKRWKWSIGKVNRYIKMLEDERMIERRYEHSETIIKLCNYDDYNSVSNDKMNTNKNSNENSDGSPTEQRQIQTKELKESKEYNNGEVKPPSSQNDISGDSLVEKKERKKVAAKKESEKVDFRKDRERRKANFKTRLWNTAKYTEHVGNIDRLKSFFEYWAEHGENDKKMRFEKETSFDIRRRLGTWARNEKKFSGNANSKPSQFFNKDVETYDEKL